MLVRQEGSQILYQFQEQLSAVDSTSQGLDSPKAHPLPIPHSWLPLLGSRTQAIFSGWPVPPSPPRFTEFEAEEETQVQQLQWMQCAQGLPPPAPPKLDPRGPPAPKVGLQPATQVPTGVERTGNRGPGLATVPMWIIFLQDRGIGLSSKTATEAGGGGVGSQMPFVTTGY